MQPELERRRSEKARIKTRLRFFLDEFVGDQFARERRSGPVFVQFQVVAVINKPSRGGFLSERG